MRTSKQIFTAAHLEVLGGWEGDAHNDDAPRVAVCKVQALRHLQQKFPIKCGCWNGNTHVVQQGKQCLSAQCPCRPPHFRTAHLAAADGKEDAPAAALNRLVVILWVQMVRERRVRVVEGKKAMQACTKCSCKGTMHGAAQTHANLHDFLQRILAAAPRLLRAPGRWQLRGKRLQALLGH